MASTFADRAGAAAFKVAAALETSGYRAQQDILKEFQGPFGEHIAALLYVIALISALVIMGAGGSYRYGLWLLVGPPVYFFLIMKTTQIQPAKWEFGDRTHSDAPVTRVYEGMGGPAEVSLFFAGWNKLTSSVIKELIKVLGLTDKKSDLEFISKSDRYFATWVTRNSDRDLQFFVHMAVTRPCMDYFYLLRFVNDPFISADRKLGAQKVLEEHGGRAATAFHVNEQQWFIPWWFRTMPLLSSCIDLTPYPGRSYTCDQMWRVGICATRAVMTEQRLTQICSIGLPDGYTTQDCLRTLQSKYTQNINNGRVLNANQDDGAAGLNFMMNEITARMLFNEFYRDSAPLMRINLGNHPDWLHNRVFGAPRYSQETAQSMRVMTEGEEYTARGEIIAAAINFPYFQGMLLFFLAWTYPFFCLMTVVPGRESAILVWMSLWLWVKLWDFGFAVVMMIDNMLYALLPHGRPMTSADMNQPGMAMRRLFETDPSYSAFTYYTLIGACIFSVPVFTGFLVKKGGHELISAVQNAVKDFPTDFGRAMGGRQKALIANEQMQQAQAFIRSEVVSAAWDAIVNDAELRTALVEAAHLTSSNAAMRATFSNFAGSPLDPRARAEALRAFQSLGPEFLSRMMTFEGNARRQQALARYEVNMQMAAYRASTSSFVTQRAHNAILLGWNSHDFRRQFPADSFLRWMQADAIGNSWAGQFEDGKAEARGRGTLLLLRFLARQQN